MNRRQIRNRAIAILDRIVSYGRQAVFLVDGEFEMYGEHTASAQDRIRKHVSLLVGVYDSGATIEALFEDMVDMVESL